MGRGTAANTHTMFDTVSHNHLDCLVLWATGEFPGSGLNLVGCADGRWFVEVDFGDGFPQIAGISHPNIAPYCLPEFFPDELSAREFAFECIRQLYPAAAGKDLHAYYED